MSAKLQVLHIENDALSRSVVRAMLGFCDVELTDTESAKAGGALIRGGGYDLVLLDLRMNDLGGLELMRALRSAGDETPIAIVTGDARVEIAETCIAAGACKVVHKPVRMADVFALVAMVTPKGRASLAA